MCSCAHQRDAFVLCSGFEYVLDVGNINLSAIRTVRVLRPLRAINRIPIKYLYHIVRHKQRTAVYRSVQKCTEVARRPDERFEKSFAANALVTIERLTLSL